MLPGAIQRSTPDTWIQFGPQHVAALLVVAVLAVNLVVRRDELARHRVDVWLVTAMVLVHLGWVSYALASGIAGPGDLLPLYTCDASILAGVAWVLWKREWWGHVLFYWSFLGGIVTLLLPDTFGYSLPHPAVLYTLVFHGLLLLLALELWAIEGLRPRAAMLWAPVVVTALIVPLALVANARFGADYMFVSRDPGGIFSFLVGYTGAVRVALNLVAATALLLLGYAAWVALDRLVQLRAVPAGDAEPSRGPA